MKKAIFTSILFLFAFFSASAQCDQCPAPTNKSFDYCYSNPAMEGKCARFTMGGETFVFADASRKKHPMVELPMPQYGERATVGFVAAFQQDKKLKLSASDVDFIYQAINSWQEMEALRSWKEEVISSGYTVLPSGLAYKVLVPGNGKHPVKGNTVTAHYTGYLVDGTKFDSSVDRGQPFQFKIGRGQVIQGWEEGIASMSEGSRYLFRIPPDLAYGKRGAGNAIPPNAHLYFDVQLISAQ